MSKLDFYRRKIDEIDKSIIRLFLLRFRIVKKIAHYKKINKIMIGDKKREFEILIDVKSRSRNHKKFLTGIFKKIISYSRKLQK